MFNRNAKFRQRIDGIDENLRWNVATGAFDNNDVH
jgi:hypothetical protein